MKKLILAFSLFTMLSGMVYSQQKIQGIFFDSEKGYYIVSYTSGNIDSTRIGTIKSNDNVYPEINACVVKKEDSGLEYTYIVKNNTEAIDPLYEFAIKSRIPIQDIINPTNQWDGFYLPKQQEVNWAKIAGNITGILPGDSLGEFKFSSSFLPSITTSYSRNYQWYSFPNEPEGPFGVLDVLIDSVYSLSNGAEFKTLGIWDPSTTISLTDTLETFRHRSCEELEWVTDAGVCIELEDGLSEVKANLQAGDSLSAANALTEFIDLVEVEKETSLTSEGYALLYFNAEYLRRRLDDANE